MKKSKIERRFNYWIAVFLGFSVAAIIFGFEILDKFLEFKTMLPISIVEFFILTVVVFIAEYKFTNRFLALELKEENCRFIRKAKKILLD